MYIRFIINAISQKKEIKEVLLLLLFFTLLQMINSFFSTYFKQIVIPKNIQIIHRKMQLEIFSKAKEVEFSCFEDANFYDQYYMAMQQSDSRALAVLNSLSTMIGGFFGITALIALLSVFDIIAIIIILVSVVFSFLINAKIVNIQKKYFVEKIPIERLSIYVQKVFIQKEFAKEIRVFNKFSVLLSKLFCDSSNKLLELINVYGIPLSRMLGLQSALGILSNTGIMIHFTYKVLLELITIGDFVALVNASQQLTEQTTRLFGIIPQFYEHSIYIESFKRFMEYTPSIKENKEAKTMPLKPHIELKNVSFMYPNTERKILKNISIEIPFGKKIAFVGANGTGKSTIIKLLLRLYNSCEGEILIDGIDYQFYSASSVSDSISVVLQDYQMYAFSIAENILMRPIEKISEDEELINSALKYVGLYEKVHNLPDGIYTNLSREFSVSGTNFSGGEYQRLAIARAYVCHSNIVILDEPSSALDPIAENQILNSMLGLMQNRTVIVVSHRLANIKNVDKIFFLENGEVIESGTHEELINLNEKYANMYKEQAEKYIISIPM